MTPFDQRWQTLTRRAASVCDEAAVDLPFGFTTRVLARSREDAGEAWEDLLSAFGLRALVITAVVAMAAAGAGFVDFYDARIERPLLEQTLTSELPWP
jgi:hypothetical protein